MAFAGVAAGVGAAASAASAINGIAGGSGGSGGTSGAPPAPNIYQPQFQPGQDQLFNTNNTNLYNNNPYPTLAPYMQSTFNGQVANPYGSGYQFGASAAGANATGIGQQEVGASQFGLPQAANIYGAASTNPYENNAVAGAQYAGNLGMNLGNSLYGAATQLPGYASSLSSGLIPMAGQSAGNLLNSGNSVLNTAFDPQNQLYAQQFQQNTDQTRAGLAARGLDMSGVGQGIENQSNLNFNTNWQNQQLGRQTQGLSAYGSAAGQANNIYGGAVNSTLGNYEGALQNMSTLGGQGVQDYQNGAALPGQAYMGNLSQLSALYGQGATAATAYGNLGQAGAQGILSGAQTPYNAYSQISSDPWTAINNYSNAYGTSQNPYQMAIGNSLNYMNSSSQAGQAQYNAQANQFTQNQAYNSNIQQGLAGLATQAPNIVNQVGSLFSGSSAGVAPQNTSQLSSQYPLPALGDYGNYNAGFN